MTTACRVRFIIMWVGIVLLTIAIGMLLGYITANIYLYWWVTSKLNKALTIG